MNGNYYLPCLQKKPQIDESCYIDKSARIVGDVTLRKNVSVWFHVSLRGDVNTITVGEGTNIQDNTVIHTTYQTNPTIIGDNVTIGHRALLHGCTIGNNVLVGMGSIILDGVRVGDHSLIAAGSLLPPGKEFPSGVMLMGSPAKVIRTLSEEEQHTLSMISFQYRAYVEEYKKAGYFTNWPQHSDFR